MKVEKRSVSNCEYGMGAETELFSPTKVSAVSCPKGSLLLPGQPEGCFDTNNSEFPAGLRVLVVDDDPICLLILDRMLQRCRYKVTTCGGAVEALRILRENKDGFDLVISDVHMPDMDGFKLLELVGLEMDLPVIMMSANGETSAVMKGIKHGACDYLLKPVRIEELKNIWQHVVRKKKRDVGASDKFEDKQRLNDSGEYHSSDGPDGSLKHPKKRKEEDDDTELENEDLSSSKKPRVVWSVELHQKFVNAVNQLGIDKAVPKRILELMDVRGLTRENVASHLQKYRLYLKRISGVAHQTGGPGSTFLGSPEADPYFLRQLAAIHGPSGGVAARPSYGPQLLNTLGGLHPAISSGLHLSQGIRYSGSLGQSDNASPAGLLDLHQLSSAAGMGGMCPIVGLDNCSPVDNSNNSLMVQILQQQNSPQMPSGAAFNTSIGGAGQLMPSGDSGARLPKAIGLNTGIGVGVGSQLRPEQPDSSFSTSSLLPSDGLNCLRPPVAVDVKSIPFTVASNIPSLVSFHGGDGGSRKGCVSNGSEVPNPCARSINPNPAFQSSGSSVSNPNAGLNSWHGWHSLVVNQSLGQKGELDLSPHYNQGYGQAYKVGCLPEQRLGLVSGFQDSIVCDASHSEQSTGEGELKLKEVPFDRFLVGSKAESGMAHVHFLSSDDALISYMKQEQDTAMGPTEGDLGVEGYTLGNMYVK